MKKPNKLEHKSLVSLYSLDYFYYSNQEPVLKGSASKVLYSGRLRLYLKI
jgi:hypothetical protein